MRKKCILIHVILIDRCDYIDIQGLVGLGHMNVTFPNQSR